MPRRPSVLVPWVETARVLLPVPVDASFVPEDVWSVLERHERDDDADLDGYQLTKLLAPGEGSWKFDMPRQ